MDDMETVDVVLEIPRTSRNRYCYDQARRVLRFAGQLNAAISLPADYGCVPGTRDATGEPLRTFLLTQEPIYPGVWVSARVLGVHQAAADRTSRPVLVCVPEREPAYLDVHDFAELPGWLRQQMTNFFDVAPRLGAPDAAPGGWADSAVARAVLAAARQRHSDHSRAAALGRGTSRLDGRRV
jgi:inorganic pyrophosphatase